MRAGILTEGTMQSEPLSRLRQTGDENPEWQRHFVHNALASLRQIKTEDNSLAEHILNAEQSLRKAVAYLNGIITS